MRENGLRKIWASGRAATNVWATIPASYATEIIAHQGWDSITVDTQHGVIDYADMVAMLTAIATTPATPLVRVGWNNPGEIMRAADAGAMGVICPTVNTKDECERFVGALRYAPMGYRSLGPNRARLMGDDYAAKANTTVLAIAQIETASGLDHVEAIAGVKSLDMLYIGPSDLGLSLGREGRMDQTDPVVVKAIDRILAVAKAAGLKAGIYCIAPDYSKQMLAKGFDLVTVLSDLTLINAGATLKKQFT
ncbi:MAG: 2,4-dihydroxyhept-2-ene-1,7-dioic acid aldolase [Alphaproteobacteria bacterium]|nr:2,4-dihydroxyhept-2-ene-1,7-dioic acid aldolase [Alphaproteobacteria bacterium]